MRRWNNFTKFIFIQFSRRGKWEIKHWGQAEHIEIRENKEKRMEREMNINYVMLEAEIQEGMRGKEKIRESKETQKSTSQLKPYWSNFCESCQKHWSKKSLLCKWCTILTSCICLARLSGSFASTFPDCGLFFKFPYSCAFLIKKMKLSQVRDM